MNATAEIKVWDLAVRCFHWLLVSCFFISYFTEEDWMDFHRWAGYIAFGLLCFRILWGFIGPRHALFNDFVYGPKRVFEYLRQVLQRKAERHLGHNPAGGAMIVALISCVMLVTLSGAALYGADAWEGPLASLMEGTSDANIALLKDIHEYLSHFTVLLVAIHIMGVVWESVLHRESLVRAMVTGRKRGV